jgi:hypothetical protein
MSYARLSDESDVYVYSTGAFFACHFCGPDSRSHFFETSADMLAHLREHMERGDRVPQRALDEIAKDQEENDREFAAARKARTEAVKLDVRAAYESPLQPPEPAAVKPAPSSAADLRAAFEKDPEAVRYHIEEARRHWESVRHSLRSAWWAWRGK